MDLTTTFRYRGSGLRIHAGPDASVRLGEEAQRLGARHALIVCGRSVAEGSDLIPRVQAGLAPVATTLFAGVRANSPLPSVEAGVEAARSAGVDLIVAVGGGSAVVTARAIAILLAEDRPIQELCTRYPPGQPPVSPRLERPKLPIFVVLTTPTNAADRAGAAVLDPATHRRLELFDPKTRPRVVIIDHAALATAPVELTRNAACNTFCMVVEALQQPELNAFAYADLRQALALLRHGLPLLSQRSADMQLRAQLAIAALLANRAGDAGAGGGGLLSGLAHQLQSRYDHIHQGPAKAVLMQPVLRFNRTVAGMGQSRLAEALGLPVDGGTEGAAEATARELEAFLRMVGMPRRLRDLGVREADLSSIAEQATTDYFVRSNPRPVSGAEELLDLLRSAW